MNLKLKPNMNQNELGGALFYPNYLPQFNRWMVGQEDLVDTHSWVDPETDFQALKLQPGHSVVTICGGACHALAYLTKQPSIVHAVDTNQTQLALLEIKAKAIQHLPDHNAVYQFLGPANHPDNLKRYQRHIRQHLSEESSAIWQARDLFGRPRYYHFKNHLYRQGKRDQFIHRFKTLAQFLGIDLVSISNSSNLHEQRLRMDDALAKASGKRWYKFIDRLPMYQEVLRRFKQYCQQFVSKENYFTSFYLGKQFETSTPLPTHLQEKNYSILKKSINRLQLHHIDIQGFLTTHGSETIDAYQLLDVQDDLSPGEITKLWEEINRTANQGAKVIFRSKHKQPPFLPILESSISKNWYTDLDFNLELYQSEKSCFYGSIFLYQKRT